MVWQALPPQQVSIDIILLFTTVAFCTSQALPEIPLVVSRASVDSFMTGIRQAAISLVPAFAGLDANDEDAFKIDQVYLGDRVSPSVDI